MSKPLLRRSDSELRFRMATAMQTRFSMLDGEKALELADFAIGALREHVADPEIQARGADAIAALGPQCPFEEYAAEAFLAMIEGANPS